MWLLTDPVVALFLSLALGYLVGKIRLGPIEVGGICGTLFIALAIGQVGVTVSPDLKNLSFALFVYSLGFTAGPQFFANLRGGWRFGIFSLIEVGVALTVTLLFAAFFHFDVGTIAGIFAGSATESAVVGTASEAIGRLGLSADQTTALQSNIATAYSLTYLFGLVGIVVFATQVAPFLLGVNLRDEAEKLAIKLEANSSEGDSGSAIGKTSFPVFVERAFHVGSCAGQKVEDFEKATDFGVTVCGVKRGNEMIEARLDSALQADDIVFIRGRRNEVIRVGALLGAEQPLPPNAGFEVTSRNVVLTRKEAIGATLKQLGQIAGPELRRGVFVTAIHRMGYAIPSLPNTELQEGDVLALHGPKDLVTRAVAELGREIPPDHVTDFVFLGLGMIVGLFIGHLSTTVHGMELTLGTGGGALVSGLIFGWINMRRPHVGAYPHAASSFAKDLGLAIFIAAVGLQAGPDALNKLKQYGLLMPIIGLIVSVLPALVSLLVGTKLMKLPIPIVLGAVAGQHCSTPTVTALVERAGNTTPVIGYTVTYALSNVILPLMGPVIVAIASAVSGG